MAEEPQPPARLRLREIATWQAAFLALGALALALAQRGSIPSLLLGGGTMFASLVLQRYAVAAALRRDGQPALAVFLTLLKLAGVLILLYVGFQTVLLGPVSFAAGATTLLMAIVLDVCYPAKPVGR